MTSGEPRPLTRRTRSLGLLLTAAAASWLAMMAFHELGHVLGAWLTGGRVERVVLHPLAFSRTDVSPNPHPRTVLWMGPLLGSLLPLALWIVAGMAHIRLGFLLRAFAGFCLIANGAYLASAVVMPVGDVQQLVRLGAPPWLLAIAGAPAMGFGLALWNGLGPRFGLGPNADADCAALAASSLSLVGLVIGMLAWSWAPG